MKKAEWKETCLKIADNETSHHQSLRNELEQVLDAVAFTVVARDPTT
jgi:hypothetical protein